MLITYLKAYWRNFTKNYLSLSLGIGGFAIGIAAFIISLLFINNELSFDGFNKNKESIFRIVYGDNDSQGSAYTAFIMGSTLKENFSDLKIARFNNAGGMRIPTSYEDRKFTETRFYFTDPEVFDVFSFRLIQGDPATALVNPFAAVITPAVAERYFGKDSPIGKALKIDWVGTSYDLTITGVMEAPPADSHLQFEMLISNATAEQVFTPKSFFTDWTANFCYNYLLVPKEKSDAIESTLQKIYSQTVPPNQRSFNVRLQPLNRIHLHSKLLAENSKNSDVTYIYIAATLSILIIVVSFINYVNIQLAVYSKRTKELGVRKVLGASAGDISTQFVVESLLNLGLACCLAFLLIQYGFSYFTEMLNTNLTINTLIDSSGFVLLFLLVLSVALCIYIVAFLSRIKPTSLLSGTTAMLTGQRAKSITVGLQAAISLMLIVGGIAIAKQITFLEEKSLGFDQEHVLTVPYGRVITNKIEAARNELVDGADVVSMSLSSQIPPSNLNFKVPCFPEGGNPNGNTEPWNVAMVVIDEGFTKTFDLKIIDGRSFSDELRNDTTESFLINESFAKQLGWKDPLGKLIEINFNPGTGVVEHKRGQVIGIVKDFHFESLHKAIEPILFIYKPTAFFYASFRLTPGDTQSKLERMKTKWSSLFPDTPFDYFFINQRLQTLYKTEQAWSKNVVVFSICAVVISCFGIFSLISFMVQSKLKEISVRKVLGATRYSIMVLMGFRVLRIVAISFIMTVPICMYFINGWLNEFAYRTTIGIDIYFIAFVSFALLTLAIISGSLVKASQTSIVDNLKKE